MKKTAKKLFMIIAVLAGLFLITLTVILVFGIPEQLEVHSSFVTSETVYIMLALLLVLPIALLMLILSTVICTKPLRKSARSTGKRHVKRGRHTRFSNLTKLDRQQKRESPSNFQTRALSALCDDFRNFAASRLHLYYDIADIRRFVAGLSISRLVLLRGMSGTGKTSLAYAAGAFFGNPSTIIPIQPMWKERSDIIGYFNEFTKRFNETTLLCKLYEAGGSSQLYMTVLDEVNIARIEYYFAEFLSLLEIPDPQKRLLDVVADSWDTDPKRLVDGKLLLPENMWFIGTANNDDSTFAISDKVYDRAAVLDLDRKCSPFVAKDTPPVRISYEELCRKFSEAVAANPLSPVLQEQLSRLDQYLSEVFRVSFGNRILQQIRQYVPVMAACGGKAEDALDDILARKILRKLEQLSPALIKNEVPKLVLFLEELFGSDSMPLCRDFLDRLQKRL